MPEPNKTYQIVTESDIPQNILESQINSESFILLLEFFENNYPDYDFLQFIPHSVSGNQSFAILKRKNHEKSTSNSHYIAI